MRHTKKNNLPFFAILTLLFFIVTVSLQQLLKNSSQPTSKEIRPHPLDSLIQTDSSKIVLTNLTPPPVTANTEGPNFVYAARRATPSVVHITAKHISRTVRRGNNSLEDLLKDFFGEGFELGPREYKTRPSDTFGSGVIISEDGFIVTNNHVVDNADSLEVTLDDNRRYLAKLVGADPDTDLALLKIEATKLPYLTFGSSEALQIGEWVLAVGNPFNLTSTVTKGIVSAKARRTDLSKAGGRMAIESFIQTDAAVNPGNSGGALVNLQGELIGINTAISTPTGAFAGYAFAIPSSIVKRVVEDLKQYGMVQRAVLGIFPIDVNADLATEKKLKRFDGVYVNKFTERSAAAEAGLREGDIIIGMNQHKIKNLAQLHENLAAYKPGDQVQVMIDRGGKEMTISVKLRNAINEIKVIRGQHDVEIEGTTFELSSPDLQRKLGLTHGIQIKNIKPGKFQQAGIKKGFIVLAIDKEKIETLDQLVTILNSKKGGILIEGIYPNGAKAYYGLGWSDL